MASTLLAFVRGEGAVDASDDVAHARRGRTALAARRRRSGGSGLHAAGGTAPHLPTKGASAPPSRSSPRPSRSFTARKVHCDVKPSNVLVDRSGRVVLIDFGVVAEFGAAGAEEQAIVGTAPYMAPEQVLGTPVGPEADWYAAGTLLFEALTGKRPFSGEAHEVMERKCVARSRRAPASWSPTSRPNPEALALAMLARDPERHRAGGAEISAH